MNRDQKYREMRGKGKFFFFPLVIMAFLALGWVVMFLWNAILPSVTGVEKLSYWQAIGLFLLSRILFGGFWPGRKGHHDTKKAHMWRKKWMSMSEEERIKFRQEWKHRCGPKGKEQENEA